MNIKQYIRDIPDFPQKGIIFKDISPLLADYKALQYTTKQFEIICKNKKIDGVIGIDSRGFIFASLLAQKRKIPFYMARKKGKLPGETFSASYTLEYGEATLEIQKNHIKKADNIMIIDDLLATGGTLKAACRLVEICQANVAGIGCVIELDFLNGRKNLKKYDVQSLIHY